MIENKYLKELDPRLVTEGKVKRAASISTPFVESVITEEELNTVVTQKEERVVYEMSDLLSVKTYSDFIVEVIRLGQSCPKDNFIELRSVWTDDSYTGEGGEVVAYVDVPVDPVKCLQNIFILQLKRYEQEQKDIETYQKLKGKFEGKVQDENQD